MGSLLCSRPGAKHQVQEAHPQHLLDGLHAAPEQVHVELLKARARDGQVEVDALKQRVDLNACLQTADVVMPGKPLLSHDSPCIAARCLGCCTALQTQKSARNTIQ